MKNQLRTLRHILALSWLVRAQIRAKRGKLTLLEALRGTKMELKGALEVFTEVSREPQRAMREFEKAAGGLIF